MVKYMKTDGTMTTSIDDYIVDLFSLYFTVLPNDIPNTPIGFNRIMSGVQKVNIVSEVTSRIGELINKMQERFSGVRMSIEKINIIDYTRCQVTINVGYTTDTLTLDVQDL